MLQRSSVKLAFTVRTTVVGAPDGSRGVRERGREGTGEGHALRLAVLGRVNPRRIIWTTPGCRRAKADVTSAGPQGKVVDMGGS